MNLNKVVISSIVIILILFVTFYIYRKKEGFGVVIPSMNSMPYNKSNGESGLPLFLNLYPNIGPDFKLVEYIQLLKVNYNRPLWNGVYKNTSSRNVIASPKLPPVIIVPGFGQTNIYARWNIKTSNGINSIDNSNNLQKSEQWSCKQVQNEWIKIWPNSSSGIDEACWANNISVHPDGNNIVNYDGVITAVEDMGSLNFATDNYLMYLIDALKSVGYREGENLFGASYDFRKIGDKEEIDRWCISISKLIEKHSYLQENKVIIIGHDLGSVVSNYFLSGALNKWKDRYISKFITVSGTFGGCPKALRNILSGNNAYKNFSGLSLMLPNSKLYGDNPLVHFNQISYTSYNIADLLNNVSTETSKIYNISNYVKNISMNAPGVETHILAGRDLNTENSYSYKLSLSTNPSKNTPFYQLELPFNQKFNYNDYFQGDGTMPNFTLEYPIIWSKYQKQPIYFKFFPGQEHTKLTDNYFTVKYIIEQVVNN